MKDFEIRCDESHLETNNTLYGKFTLGPFLPGQGTTFGNALRRSLLAELSGLAITAFEVIGAMQEFSTLPGLRESILDLSLNLKQIVLTGILPYSTPPIGFLNIRGPAVVKAADLKLPAGIFCASPNQYIATLSSNGILHLKFIVSVGKGYSIQPYSLYRSLSKIKLQSYLTLRRENPRVSANFGKMLTIAKSLNTDKKKKNSLLEEPFFEQQNMEDSAKQPYQQIRKESLRKKFVKLGMNKPLSCEQPIEELGIQNQFGMKKTNLFKSKFFSIKNPILSNQFETSVPPTEDAQQVPQKACGADSVLSGAYSEGIKVLTSKKSKFDRTLTSSSYEAEKVCSDVSLSSAKQAGGTEADQIPAIKIPYGDNDVKSQRELEERKGKLNLNQLQSVASESSLPNSSVVGNFSGYANIQTQIFQRINPHQVLPIDAVFTPVSRVNFLIQVNDRFETARENILLEIWTNGSIHPRRALEEATLSLVQNFDTLLKKMQQASSLYKGLRYSAIGTLLHTPNEMFASDTRLFPKRDQLFLKYSKNKAERRTPTHKSDNSDNKKSISTTSTIFQKALVVPPTEDSETAEQVPHFPRPYARQGVCEARSGNFDLHTPKGPWEVGTSSESSMLEAVEGTGFPETLRGMEQLPTSISSLSEFFIPSETLPGNQMACKATPLGRSETSELSKETKIQEADIDIPLKETIIEKNLHQAIYKLDIGNLNFSLQTFIFLKKAKIQTLSQLLTLFSLQNNKIGINLSNLQLLEFKEIEKKHYLNHLLLDLNENIIQEVSDVVKQFI